jgi:hypothetical protein
MYPVSPLRYIGDKDVVGFDIPMDDASLMEIVERTGNLEQNASDSVYFG